MTTNRGIKNLRGAPRQKSIPAEALPERFNDLGIAQQTRLLDWIALQPPAAICAWTTTCATLACRFRNHHDDGWLPDCGSLKGAMLQSGYGPRSGELGNPTWTFEKVMA